MRLRASDRIKVRVLTSEAAISPTQIWPNLTLEVDGFARRILAGHLLPPKAAVDAFHIATATAHGLHFLLTWNCAHINNGEIIPGIGRLASAEGYALPVICTSLELMGISEA
jgi:hypothetical protein